MSRFWLPVLILLLLAGCRKPNAMVGTWKSSMGRADTTWRFYDDGRLETQVMYPPLIAKTKGTYSLDGDRLTLQSTEAEVQGPEPEASAYKSQLLNKASLQIKWNSPLSLTVEIPGVAGGLTLTKVSSVPK